MHPEQTNQEQATEDISLRPIELSYEGRTAEVREIFNEIMENPARMFDLFRLDVKRACERAIEKLIAFELTVYLGRKRYERTKGKHKNYRNGSYPRSFTAKGIGTMNFDIPRDRNGQFHSKVIKRYERYEEDIARDVQAMFLSGMSTRSIELFSEHLLGRKISSGEV
ncbi:MAG: transposase, partial [Caldisericum sp.]|uniref:transposase n=1 Tax=Caldisericum sp. TaxID=2499687 RepID=UPI003D140E6C